MWRVKYNRENLCSDNIKSWSNTKFKEIPFKIKITFHDSEEKLFYSKKADTVSVKYCFSKIKYFIKFAKNHSIDKLRI